MQHINKKLTYCLVRNVVCTYNWRSVLYFFSQGAAKLYHSRTKDTHEDADLGKESLFRKSARYLGFEKAPFDPKSPPEVLVELMLINEKDSVRSGFQAIDKTYDTRERCLKRKILCARFEPWAPNLTAITDLLIFSRMGDHLTGRTYVGDLSSQAILACVQTVLSSPTDGIIPKRPAPKAGPYSLSGDMSSPIFQPMLNRSPSTLPVFSTRGIAGDMIRRGLLVAGSFRDWSFPRSDVEVDQRVGVFNGKVDVKVSIWFPGH
ncbi:unnamed protein product [Schistocephalus solidus]|uniref:MABP domain-containing protein n=1 Tax=Schistocephalus solidus TaxID=70667 RepID=A0A183S913_SCHSO|nr:unnamed protein product [Schistocephalus solidus]